MSKLRHKELIITFPQSFSSWVEVPEHRTYSRAISVILGPLGTTWEWDPCHLRKGRKKKKPASPQLAHPARLGTRLVWLGAWLCGWCIFHAWHAAYTVGGLTKWVLPCYTICTIQVLVEWEPPMVSQALTQLGCLLYHPTADCLPLHFLNLRQNGGSLAAPWLKQYHHKSTAVETSGQW